MWLFIWWREDTHPYSKSNRVYEYVTEKMCIDNNSYWCSYRFWFIAEAKPPHTNHDAHDILRMKNYKRQKKWYSWLFNLLARCEYFFIRNKILNIYDICQENSTYHKSIKKQPHIHFYRTRFYSDFNDLCEKIKEKKQ